MHANIYCRLFSKVPGWEFASLTTVVWDLCSTTPDHKQLCAKVSPGISQQVWEMFICLDVDSQGKVHLEDICDLIQRILRENGHSESEQNIREWFCEETMVDFWSFFAAVIENFAGLMKVSIAVFLLSFPSCLWFVSLLPFSFKRNIIFCN